MSEEMNRDERREFRRKRRIRNQIIAWLVLIVILAGVFYGGYRGLHVIYNRFNHEGDVPVQTVSEDIAQTESSNEVVATSEPVETVSEDVVEEPPVEEPDPIREVIASMTLEQKVGGLFFVTPESITGVDVATRAGDGTRTALEANPVGGIVYSSKNVTSADQFKEMVRKTGEMYAEIYDLGEDDVRSVLLLVQEEGAQNTIAGSASGVRAQDSAEDIGQSGDNTNAYQAYLEIGSCLNQYGIDVDLAPVCDVRTEDSFIGKRSFSDDADIAASMVRSAVSGLEDQSILSCLTTFPGQGSLSTDTAKGSAVIDRTLDEMRSFEFLPFISGLEEGADMVMVSHASAEAATGDSMPCSMSYAMIGEILRGELGFEGVVMTDYLNKAAITSNYSAGEAAVNALQAGVDVLLCPADYAEAYNAVLDAVNNGEIPEERIEDSLYRIYSMKAGN